MWKAIIKLVESWSYRCEHDWEYIEEINYYKDSTSKHPHRKTHVYRCKKCCEFKKFEIS